MQDYSRLDRLLHRLVFDAPKLNELLFDLEQALFLKRGNSKRCSRPVYVVGLARAGTTSLMRALHDSGEFASLTYDDMPFVMAPNLWQVLSRRNKKRRVSRERGHGDHIEVDFDSPEALEEVFWRTFHGKEYIRDNSLVPHQFYEDSAEALAAYQALVCKKYGKARYLAKNNNHLLRLPSLVKYCGDAIILIPFRDPLVQAYSLWRQHRKFQNAPPFTQRYMEWLSHYEFGATHRPYIFGAHSTVDLDPDVLDYWLERWIDAYGFVIEFARTAPPNVIAVCYEQLCGNQDYWVSICRLVEIPHDAPASFSAPPLATLPSANRELVEKAQAIYQQLAAIS